MPHAISPPSAIHWKRTLTMRDVMTPQPLTIGKDQTLERAHEMMREFRIRHLPVLDRGVVIGVLTLRDLYFLETIDGVKANIDHVEDAMSPDVYAVGFDDKLTDVAAHMAQRKLGCAVVMENTHVVGIFTVTDALRVLAAQ